MNPALLQFPAFRGPRRAYPQVCVHDLFDQQARNTPDAVALIFRDRSLSYSQLRLQVHRLARQLRDSGVCSESVVGVLLENSVDAVVALLAILQAGGALLPLDRRQPQERIAYFIRDAKPITVVTTEECQPLLPESVPRLILPGETSLECGDPEPVPVNTNPDSAVCILYTSGSTGQPKGVIREHSALVSRLAWASPEEDSVYCHNMSLTLGLSYERLLISLILGRPVVVIPDDDAKDAAQLAQALERDSVTDVTFAPLTLREFLGYLSRTGAHMTKLRNVGVGGDVLTRDLLDLFRSTLPNATLWNNYGSTEVGAVTRGVMSGRSADAQVTVGTPLANVDAYILDPAMSPLPFGVTGELYLGAPSLAREYLHEPDRTAERFVENPFQPGSRLFRTGDLARFLPNGEIELAGRADRQVKIRGHRIELAEVEAALELHPSVESAVAVAWGQEGSKRLVAYATCTNGRTPSTNEIRRFVRERLPDSMVPSSFVTLDCIPRALNGKVDVSALPPPGAERPQVDSAYEPPRSPTEKTLAAIWAEVLGQDRVGAFDDFFELGGDSLLAVHMLLRVAEVFQTAATGSALAENSTLEALARVLNDLAERNSSRIEAIRPVSRDSSLRLSISQEFTLATQLIDDIRQVARGGALLGFGLMLEGELNTEILQKALREIVRRHEVLRTGFSPVATVGNFQIRGWTAIQVLFARGSIKPGIRFEPLITGSAEIPWTVWDIREAVESEQESAIEKIVEETIGTFYDYAAPPLMRAVLLRTAPGSHRLVVGVSHLVFDGWSRPIFQRELGILYEAFNRGEGSPLAELPTQHLDFAHWQRQQLQGERLQELLRYWTDHYRRFPALEAMELPFARRPNAGTRRGGVESIDLAPSLCRELRAFVAEQRSTLFILFLMTVTHVLSIYTRRDRVSVASYFANRTHPGVQNLIGDFATAHRIGVDLSRDPSVSELMDQIRATVTGATAHQEIPTSLLLRLLSQSGGSKALQLPWGPWITCEFMAHKPVASPESLNMEPVGLLGNLSGIPAPQPLRFICRDSGANQIRWIISYHTDVFEKDTAQGVLAHLMKVLRESIGSPQERISTLSRRAGLAAERASIVSR